MNFPFRDFWERLIGKIWRIAPTILQSELTFNLDDYGKKEIITISVTGAQRYVAQLLFKIKRKGRPLSDFITSCFLLRAYRPQGQNESKTNGSGTETPPERNPIACGQIEDRAGEDRADEASDRAREHGHAEKEAVRTNPEVLCNDR